MYSKGLSVAVTTRKQPPSEQQDTPDPSQVFPSRYQVGLAVVLGAVFLIGLAPKLDTDLWWHLKVGAYVWSHHAVPSRDFMSFTFAGHPWIDHEWLAELLLYDLYSLAGLWGPIVFFALLICATFGLVYARMAASDVNRILALFVLAAAFVSSSASWGARPQMLTLFFLSAYMWILSRFQLTRNGRLLIVFPFLMLLWTNLHGGFVLGLVVLALTLAGEWVNRLTGSEDAWSAEELRALAIAFVATFAVTIVNPNGIRQLLYPLTFIFPNAFTNSITESVSPNFHMPVMMLFEAMLLILIAAAFVARSRLNWTHLFFVLAFTHLAVSQGRNVPLWAVVISPLVALTVSQAIAVRRTPEPAARPRRSMRKRTERMVNIALLAAVGLVYPVEAFHFVSQRALRHSEASAFPAGAVSYMQTHALPPRTLASYSWAGYVLWKLYPRYRDFIDGRADTLYNSRILSAYLAAASAAPNWETILNRYGVQNVLVEPASPLAAVLAQNAGWRLVYHDGTAVLYTRR